MNNSEMFLYVKTLVFNKNLSWDFSLDNDNSVTSIILRDSSLVPILCIDDTFPDMESATTFIYNITYQPEAFDTSTFKVPSNNITQGILQSLLK
jgi:hypothetical protein